MNNLLQILILLFLIVSPIQVSAQTNFPDFLQELINEYVPVYKNIYLSEYEHFSKTYELDVNNEDNKNKYFQIRIIHDLFTGVSATNCSSGGILNIPYFWHWTEPNPRHEIRLQSDSVSLSNIKPPIGFLKYKSYADIDRTPSLFISDLLTATPKYFHKNCGNFYTFGWCSEREMAFNTILSILDFQVKIKQEDIHTWSEILVKFESRVNKSKFIEFQVDNTFDIITTKLVKNDNSINEWKSKIGNGTSINWYNSKAHSETEINKVKNLIVNKEASIRINDLIKKWIPYKE